MVTRKQIVKVTNTWVDTPYHHQAGVKGVGVDCAYLVGHIAVELKLIDTFVVAPYSIEWHWHNNTEEMIKIIESFGCVEKSLDKIKPGDILAFKYGRVCSHLGIFVGDNNFVHAHLKAGKVLLNSLEGDFLKRLTRVYSFPGIK